MAEVDLGLNLYDFNKKAMSQLPPLDPIEFNKKTSALVKDIYSRTKEDKYYWMLLNNERRDYTVFIPLTEEGTLEELRPTLQNRGMVLDITKQPDDNYEIWIRDPATQENFVYYLFDYTFGVIKA